MWFQYPWHSLKIDVSKLLMCHELTRFESDWSNACSSKVILTSAGSPSHSARFKAAMVGLESSIHGGGE